MVDARDGLRERIKSAMLGFASLQGRTVTRKEFGALVAKDEGVPPYSERDVDAWLDGSTVPSLSTLLSIGALVEFDESSQMGFLVYGSEHSIYSLADHDFRHFYRGRQIASVTSSDP